jgi:hypothetical protein
VAVELVLESGVVSVEHVLNVIGRLKQEAPPEAVQTHLAVKEAPIADTGRYDRCAARRSTMREIAAELKALRLYGMAGAWSELTERADRPGWRCAVADRASARRRRDGSGHALDPLPDDGGALPDPPGPGRFRLRAILRGSAPD